MDIAQLREKLSAVGAAVPAPPTVAHEWEVSLQLKLHADILDLLSIWDGEGLHGIEMYPFEGSGTTVLTETLRLRRDLGLAQRFVILAEPEGGPIIIDNDDGRVAWCGLHNVALLSEAIPADAEVWASPLEFLDYLIGLSDD